MSETALDYTPLVRGVVKLAVALGEADELAETKYNKFKLKKVLNRWIDRIEELTEPTIKEFYADSPDALDDVYKKIGEKLQIELKNDDRLKMLKFYCMVKSAMNDLEEFPFRDKKLLRIGLMFGYSNQVVSQIEKQYGDIARFDTEEATTSGIVKYYDELGKRVLYSK